jgi:hypothetical protein
MSDGALAVAFSLEGHIDALRIPPAQSPRRSDLLWLHTCFEAFVALPGEPGYRELNFAPSGEWAAYGFRRYRERVPLDWDPDPDIVVCRTATRLELSATFRLFGPARTRSSAPLQLALSAVIEDVDGRLSFWALRHPPGKPDFHHPDAFALELGAVAEGPALFAAGRPVS